MGFFDVLNRIFPPRQSGPLREPGRNETCYCGSGKKYKSCHLLQDQKKRAARGR